jgi:antitoxin component of RelBE/YafQ-DinJ toxin-antitoxin module
MPMEICGRESSCTEEALDTGSVSTYYVLGGLAMNLTLSIDERLVDDARKVAATMGKSVNQLIREYLEQLTSASTVEEDLTELRRLSKQSKGSSKGWKFDRDEIHARP